MLPHRPQNFTPSAKREWHLVHITHERRRVSTVFAVETAAARRTQLIARDTDLQLRFDDLFGNVAADFDHAFVVGLAGL